MGIIYQTGDYLAHHGIKGQKWGIRRFQNLDGTLTAAGKERYSNQQARNMRTAELLSFEGYKVKSPGKYHSNISNRDKKYLDLYAKFSKATGDIAFARSDDDYSKEAKKIIDKIVQIQDRAMLPLRELRKKFDIEYDDIATRYGNNDTEFEKAFDRLNRRYGEASSRFYNSESFQNAAKHVNNLYDELAGQALQDLGYNDTKEARKVVRQLTNMDWG